VSEHLRFYARLKGLVATDIEDAIRTVRPSPRQTRTDTRYKGAYGSMDTTIPEWVESLSSSRGHSFAPPPGVAVVRSRNSQQALSSCPSPPGQALPNHLTLAFPISLHQSAYEFNVGGVPSTPLLAIVNPPPK